MPKKTKRSKILAETRRTFAPHSPDPSPSTSKPEAPHSTMYRFSGTPSMSHPSRLVSSDTTTVSAIGADLTKTIVLAILAITVEIVLYFILR